MKKIVIIIITLFTATVQNITADNYRVESPSKKIEVKVNVDKEISYQVLLNGTEIIADSEISLSIDSGQVFGEKARVKKSKITSVDKNIEAIIPRKFSSIKDNYNELKLDFKGNYSLVIRAYDDGLAYRWVSNLKGSYNIKSELSTFNFTGDHKIWFPEERSVYTHQERQYLPLKLSDISSERFCSTGTLVVLEDNKKVYISESDLISYPGMFLKGSKETPYGLVGKYAGYPLEVAPKGDRDVRVVKHADFLAKVEGARSFPWRVMLIAEDDADLILSELIYKLATPLQLKDTDWIKPGKVAWDWWNANNIYGVDFVAGVNTETYKYYIDFAAEFGLEYINLDEGWYPPGEILKEVSNIDIKALVEYAKLKDVGVILWVTWKDLEENMDKALQKFENWGIKGIKVDFMQRDDQWMVEYYHRLAKKAADKHLLVSYHGAYKPTGMRRAYPNVITREAVMGLEQSKWGKSANPENDLLLPFIRMVSGPMDYTPGAMKNAIRSHFKPIGREAMSSGTRCHQLAMYVIFESPLQMLADNPSNYYKEPECMQFLKRVPTVWDDTKVLQAELGEYLALARRSGDEWYIGAMTNWKRREMTLNFDFLPDGDYQIQIWQDGVNAHRYGADYKMYSRDITKGETVKIKLAPGGGWSAIIQKK